MTNVAAFSRRSLVAALTAVAAAPRLALAQSAANQRLRRFLLTTCFANYTPSGHPTVGVDPKGAVGRNSTDPASLERQDAGFAWVQRGLWTRQPDWVARGWRAFDWAIARQDPAGGIASGDQIHETTLFLEALANALTIDPANATPARLKGLNLGVRWLLDPGRNAHAVTANAQFTHRTWMRASLFGASAELLGQPDLSRTALQNVRQGLAQQTPEGAYPERGGTDVGYHIFGMTFQQRWMALNYRSGADYNAVLASMLRALDWYGGKVGASGEIDRAGSTRIGHEGRAGKTKDVNYARAIEVALGASLLTGDAAWARFAEKLEAGGTLENKLSAKAQNAPLVGAKPAQVVATCSAF